MSNKFNILMVATGSDHQLMMRLITSIEENIGTTKVGMVLINQGSAADFTGSAFEIYTIQHNQRCSLSKARNLGLAFITQHGIAADHILFPDDDTTFDAGFFKSFRELVKPQMAYLGRVCNQEDGADYKNYPQENKITGTRELLPYVASVALIIPFELMQKTGGFNEDLGAGAKWASSEDLDYFLRCCRFQPFTYLRALRNFHPGRFEKYHSLTKEEIRQRFKGYTDGYLFVMYKYGLTKNARMLPLRAIGGAVLSALKLHFRLVPVYTWLALYRFKMLRFFSEKKKRQPDFFSDI